MDILPIEKEIFLDADSPLRNIDDEKPEVPIHNDLENYIFYCSQSLSLLSTSIDKTKLSIELLEKSYQSAPELTQTQNTADVFVEYAIENYFIRSSAIYDRCLIFVNRVLDLGIHNESIGHIALVTNEHVKKHGLDHGLKAIRKKCTEYRVERNKIVHHGRYGDEFFNNIAAMHRFNNFQKELGHKPTYGKELLDELTYQIIDIQVDEFTEHLASIEAKLHQLYELVLPIYQLKKNEFGR